jgi:hypothetical protein
MAKGAGAVNVAVPTVLRVMLFPGEGRDPVSTLALLGPGLRRGTCAALPDIDSRTLDLAFGRLRLQPLHQLVEGDEVVEGDAGEPLWHQRTTPATGRNFSIVSTTSRPTSSGWSVSTLTPPWLMSRVLTP